MSYTKEELKKIAEAIHQFNKAGSKEIAHGNPITGEVVVYSVPLLPEDKVRLSQIRNQIDPSNVQVRNSTD